MINAKRIGLIKLKPEISTRAVKFRSDGILLSNQTIGRITNWEFES